MKVAIVAGVVVPNDAISAAVIGQAQLLSAHPAVDEVSVFAQSIGCELPCAAFEIGDAWSLARHPVFRTSDQAIYHWGIRYDLFDALTLASRHGPRSHVHFHNCTPADLVPAELRSVIERSLRQIHHVVSLGMPIWTYSEFNRRTLADWGVAAHRIRFVPFAIEPPPGFRPDRSGPTVQLITVGRLTPAKGQDTLIDALALLSDEQRSRVHLRVVSSTTFSESAFAAALEQRVVDRHLGDVVEFHDSVAHDELWRLYGTSHVVVSPSLHEGLCVPVIEGYAAGCRAIGTTAGNLQFVVQPPDPVVAPGDVDGLRRALESVTDDVVAGRHDDRSRAQAVVDSYSSASVRSHLERELGLATAHDHLHPDWPLRRSDEP